MLENGCSLGVLHVCITSVVVAASAATATAQSVFVDAKANIFGYGVSTPSPGGGGGGIVAPTILLTPGMNRTVTFSASGISGWPQVPTGPDGDDLAPTIIPAVGPIAGYFSPVYGELVGLFITNDILPTDPAPSSLSYPDLDSLQAASFSPGLQQPFFIGDGLTGTGTGVTQVFNIPDGAETLVLGIADSFNRDRPAGFYDDNTGGFDVNFNIIPAPATGTLLALCGFAATRRRR